MWILTPRAQRVFRAGLAVVLLRTVVDRWAVLRAYYSDDGVLPVRQWRAETSSQLLDVVCVHAWSGEVWWQQGLSVCQGVLALALAANVRPRLAALASLWLYASATMRFVTSAYILDRYVILELVLAACALEPGPVVSSLWRLQLLWIYVDAGLGKAWDPGWSWTSELPALDAYVRFTFAATLVRRLLGVNGLRRLTPLVPAAELAAPALAHVASLAPGVPARALELFALAIVALLHVGIGLTMNGAGALSVAALVAWLPALPLRDRRGPARLADVVGACALTFFLVTCVVFAIADQRRCLDARASPLSTLFHNRWNVFTGSDPTVTWEIVPAKLADGTIVDLWAHGSPVSWAIPKRAARPGRWRTFPMLSQTDAPQSVLHQTYSYFCREWNRGHDVAQRVLHFHVYMLQTDVRNVTNVTKRLLHAQQC